MSVDKGTLDQLRIDRSSAPQPSSKPWVLGIVVLLLAVAAAVWWLKRGPQAIPVRTADARQVATGGKQTLLNGSGYVTARREATVSSKVTGKVTEVLVEEGMKVEAGQVLARLDAANIEANLKLAEAQLTAAKSGLNEIKVRLDEANLELSRVTRLTTEKIATQTELDRADAEVKSLRARLDQQVSQIAVAERQLALWHQQLDDMTVRAPFGGIVTAKNAQPGEMISPMSAGGGFTRTGICTIVDMSSLEVEVDVNESFINRVEEGQPVLATLDAYPDWKIPARVIALIPTADRQKATVKVRVGFDALDPRILPEMGVKVAFQSSGEAAASTTNVVVPRSALRESEGRKTVWIVRDGRLERRAVSVAEGVGDEVTVLGGLNGGERIVIEGPSDLVDGAAIKETKP
jgi:RND family efflux transporter MFP subunit